jgi:hypothetical protein
VSETEAFTKRRDSFIHGVSVRGTAALVVIVTICVSMLIKYPVEDPLKTMAYIIGAYYFAPREQTK